MAVGQVFYTPWCDEHGQVIDDGTVARLEEQLFRWTAADPSLRWFRQNAAGLRRRDRGHLGSDRGAGAAGADVRAACCARRPTPTSTAEVLPRHERHHRRRHGRHLAHRLHRRSRLRDLDAGVDARHGLGRADGRAGRPFDIKPCGMLALDVARVEAGLLLIDVDFFSSKKALIESQQYSPYEMGLGRLVSLDKGRFIGQQALREEHARGPARQIVGLEIDWTDVEADLRGLGLRAGGRRDRITRRRAGLPRRPPGRPGDDDDLVAGAEADDRARDGRPAALRRRNEAAVRSDASRRPPPGRRDGRQDAVLQSAERRDRPRRRPSGRRRQPARSCRVQLHDHPVEGVQQILAIRVRARRVGARRDARPATARRRASPAGSSDPRTRSRRRRRNPAAPAPSGGSATRRC